LVNGSLEIKNPNTKIKLMHLVTEPETNSKEIRSIENIKDFCNKTGIKYEQRINEIWNKLPPIDTCARPQDVQDKPGYYKLAPGHYGCYLAHKNAICAEDNTEYDFVLIVEGDVIIDSDYQELYNSLIRFNKLSYQTDMDVIGFGNPWQDRNLNGPKIEDIYTNVTPFIPAQSYLINNLKTKKIKELLETMPWDAIDLWMCNVARLKIGTAEKIYTKHLPGFSIVEQANKDSKTDNPLIFTK
jgi:GR25 family glycosyltransferase involved in LPS biosynthesis